MDKFIRRICLVFLQAVGHIMTALCEGIACPEAEVKIQARCEELARVLYSMFIEEIDRQLRENREAREGWTVVRDDGRSALSLMGELEYSRTYYRNKETGKHRHLLDDVIGMTPHGRLTPALRAKLVGNSCEMAYGKAGVRTGRCKVAGQTVMNSLRKLRLGQTWENAASSAEKKRRVSALYVEADEDHISGNRNGKKRIEPKLVYVHEGRKGAGPGRGALINPKYFGGVYNDPDELWWEVHRYIEQTYDASVLEAVFVTGDGASWITLGTEFVEKGVRLPDLFHLRKYIVAASHGDKAVLARVEWTRI